jgi:hypothetical protein
MMTVFVPAGAQSQRAGSKPMLILKIENEGDNLTRPEGVTNLSPAELNTLRSTLAQQLAGVFTIIPETDKRDCIELSVSIEKLTMAHQMLFVASSAVAVGKGDSDLFLTHDAIVQPSLSKVAAALTFQMSMMSLQARLRSISK